MRTVAVATVGLVLSIGTASAQQTNAGALENDVTALGSQRQAAVTSVLGRVTTPMPTLTAGQLSNLSSSVSSRTRAPLGTAGASPVDPKSRSSRAYAPSNYGTGCSGVLCIPYTTARVANSSVNGSATTTLQPVGGMPYVATGRLLMATTTAGVYNSVCSASLIGRGLVVTAAHCIQKYGQGSSGTVKSAIFIPANTGNTTSSGPYGGWSVGYIIQPNAYKFGTDTCQTGATGVVCNNDVAVLVLNKNSSGKYPYQIPQIGYYSYGWNGFGFVTPSGTSGQGNAVITQLGYPCGLDNCQLMQRNDSEGQLSGTGSGSSPKQITIGSQMTGGSSGGPWLVNFGTASTLGSAASAGAKPVRNVVQGTTSWGYTNNTIQIQGASFFGQNAQYKGSSYSSDGRNYGAGNIGSLVNTACNSKGVVKGKTKGACFTSR